MDLNLARSLVTLAAFAAFLGIVWWAYGSARRERFFRYWVAKESALKAEGCGLGFPLERFEVVFDGAGDSASVTTLEPQRMRPGWTVRMLSLGPGWPAAVCSRGGPWSLRPQPAPRSLAELAGQDHVVTALANGLARGRLHHAYLLTGTRGVGKTTIARILAKSLNCLTHGVSATPCGTSSRTWTRPVVTSTPQA